MADRRLDWYSGLLGSQELSIALRMVSAAAKTVRRLRSEVAMVLAARSSKSPFVTLHLLGRVGLALLDEILQCEVRGDQMMAAYGEGVAIDTQNREMVIARNDGCSRQHPK